MALLSFQFLLGAYLNLYVTIPSGRNFGALDLGGLVVLVLHALLGLSVLGTSLRLTLVAVKTHDRRRIGLAVLATIGVALGLLAGADFALNSQSDASSFTMAFGFFLGMVASALLLAGAHVPRPAAESAAQ